VRAVIGAGDAGHNTCPWPLKFMGKASWHTHWEGCGLSVHAGRPAVTGDAVGGRNKIGDSPTGDPSSSVRRW
jgi:hypothetical protein